MKLSCPEPPRSLRVNTKIAGNLGSLCDRYNLGTCHWSPSGDQMTLWIAKREPDYLYLVAYGQGQRRVIACCKARQNLRSSCFWLLVRGLKKQPHITEPTEVQGSGFFPSELWEYAKDLIWPVDGLAADLQKHCGMSPEKAKDYAKCL